MYPQKFVCESPKNLCNVFKAHQRQRDNFSVAWFFLKLVWQNGKMKKDMNARKEAKADAAGQRDSTKIAKIGRQSNCG